MTNLTHRFNVGDHVRIKTWEEMGGNPNGNRIYFDDNISFVHAMRHLCGMEFTVRKVYKYRDATFCYHSEEGIEIRNNDIMSYWLLTDNMLEIAGPEQNFDISDTDFDLLLGGSS